MEPSRSSLSSPLLFCAPLFRGLQSVDQESDEAIYSYAVESILETGDWLNPRLSPITDIVFLEKPPLKFWIVALPIRLGLLPANDFGLRFWDALFGSAAFLYVFAFGRRLAGWPCGIAALLILYTFDRLLFNHGLRSNNMEASVVLCYAGGLYHYLRWAETRRAGRRRAHAVAVGAYFFLGFMTKFVAALFLPAVIGAASLELPAIRAKVWREWRTWAAVVAGVALLVAPWFVYQTNPRRAGGLVDHARRPRRHAFPFIARPGAPASLELLLRVPGGRPRENGHACGRWPAGAVLIHARVVRERWLAGTLVLYWFWLPFVLISFGCSKLWHYAYPFLPPVGLAAGYAVGALANAAAVAHRGDHDPVRRRSLALPTAIASVGGPASGGSAVGTARAVRGWRGVAGHGGRGSALPRALARVRAGHSPAAGAAWRAHRAATRLAGWTRSVDDAGGGLDLAPGLAARA